MNVTLQKCNHRMSGADRVVTDYWDGKLTFEFRDRTHIHGQYQVGSSIAKAPDNAVGAVKIGEDWHWCLITPPTQGEAEIEPALVDACQWVLDAADSQFLGDHSKIPNVAVDACRAALELRRKVGE